jgi:mono/diheme cytochrome c family protein
MIAGSRNMQNRVVRVAQRFVTGVVIAGIVAAAAGFFIAARAQNATSGDAASGKKIYLADGCFMCHGRAGQGGGFNYPTPALAQLEMPEESFIAFLREAPRDMPTYSKAVLSDKEAADIYAFLHSLPGRKSPKDFPLLNN